MKKIPIVLFISMIGISLWSYRRAETSENGQETTVPVTSSENKSPIGQWTFDEGEGIIVTDSSGSGNNGRIVNEEKKYPVKWIDGRRGKGLEFTAEDRNSRNVGYVVIPNMGKYDFSKGITVEAWIMMDKKMDVNENMIDIVTTMSSNYGPGFRLYILWRALRFISGEGVSTPQKPCWGAITNILNTQITPDVWHHIAGTYDGSVFRVYFDGEEAGVSGSGLGITQGTKDITIGSFPGGHSYGFAGIIDDVRIYDYALSDVQILKHAKFG